MSEAKKIRNKWLTIRMTEAEYEELRRLSKKTTCSQLSQYGRNVLLNKPVYIKYRSESLDAFLNAIVDLRREFKAVGFNFNQVVHKLHTLQEIPEFRLWVLVNEKHKDLLFSKIKAIQDRMNEAYDLWQTSEPTEEQKAGK
jgi:hypothetical protein